MILIPDIKTIVLLVPRTGSGTLSRAVMAKYTGAFMLYRHMEASGVPFGYEHWRKVGVVRNPLARLWSLYKFLKVNDFRDAEHNAVMRASVDRPFTDWLLNNDVPFMGGGTHATQAGQWPQFSTTHILPENVKSQRLYLRPDLGTEVFRYGRDLHDLARTLGVDLSSRHNATADERCPVNSEVLAHIRQHFAWDMEASA